MKKAPNGPFLLGALVLSLAALFTGCPSKPTPIAAELQSLQGTWEGAVVGDKSDDKITITITGNSFHFHRDTTFWFETTITLPSGTDPQQLRATIKGCAPAQGKTSIGKVVVAIFKIEDGTLTLVARGDGAEEAPKSFETTEDKGLNRYELRKVQPRSTGFRAGEARNRPARSSWSPMDA